MRGKRRRGAIAACWLAASVILSGVLVASAAPDAAPPPPRPAAPNAAATEIRRLRQERQARTASWKRRGFPTTAAEYAPRPPADRRDNAALLYRPAFALPLKADGVGGAAASPDDDAALDAFLGDPLAASPDQVAAVRGVMQRRHRFVELARNASLVRRCVFPRRYANAPLVPTEEIPVARELARHLLYQAALERAYRRPANAASGAARVFGIARHLGQNPTLRDQYAAALLADEALETLRLSLREGWDQPAVPEAAQTVLEQTEAGDETERASLAFLERFNDRAARDLVFQLARAVDASLKERRDVTADLPGAERAPAGVPAAATVKAGDAASWDLWAERNAREATALLDRVLPVLAAPETDAPALDAVLARETDRWKQGVASDRGRPSRLTMAGNVLGMLQLAVETRRLADGARARRAVLQAAAFVLAYRQKEGKLPADLVTALPVGGALPRDPFGGGPVRYLPFEGRGFIVHSVGPTGKFNPVGASDADEKDEAVFRFTLPPPP